MGKFVTGKPTGKRVLGKPKHGWEENIIIGTN